MGERCVYLMISRTPTRFGSVLRRVGHIQYNHAAIALDRELNELYSFARLQHSAFLVGGLVQETVGRYTLGGQVPVEIVLFRLPVSEQQYDWVEQTIARIRADHDYQYNLFSVISYPLTKGFSTYKAYSCIEFVMYLLSNIGIQTDRPLHCYKPDDLLALLPHRIAYQGELTEYKPDDGCWGDYFESVNFRMARDSAAAIGILLVRLVFRRRYRTKFTG
jgi:hypothetical protein